VPLPLRRQAERQSPLAACVRVHICSIAGQKGRSAFTARNGTGQICGDRPGATSSNRSAGQSRSGTRMLASFVMVAGCGS
jgi:hypothetical protein